MPRLDFSVEASGGNAALLIAARKGHTKVVAFLLQRGVPPFAKGTSPLHAAAEHGHLAVVKLLLTYNRGPVGEAGAGRSVAAGREEAARRGLHQLDKKGNTPLILACKKGHLEAVSFLYSLVYPSPGSAEVPLASFYACQDSKKRPLHAAARGGHLEVVRYLVEIRREGVDSLHGKQATPLHFASKGGNVDVIAYFADSGADLDARNKRGRTPIFVASLYGCNKAVAFLIEKGADVDLATFNGETPLSVALKYERKAIASLLLNHGAKQ